MSGTTSISVLIRGRTLVVANVGDSRAVLAERVGGRILAQDLSIDQTPYRWVGSCISFLHGTADDVPACSPASATHGDM